jgi:hypothetical protein
MGIKVANNAFATLASGITSSATSITVASGQGARFPILGAGDYFYATLINTSNQLEIVRCTARSADVLTVVRAQESTTARAYDVGDRIEIRITAATFEDATTIPDGSITAAKLGSDAPLGVSGKANTATDYFQVPRGTTAQRPASPANGMVRFNTDLNYLEEFRSGVWQALSNVFSATGGTETTINIGGVDYKVHTFTSSGSFTVLSGTANVEYLVIAGGGGGGNQHNGGGGAGGYRSSVIGESSGGGAAAEARVFVTSGSYPVTVGAGGAGTPPIGNGNNPYASTGAASSAFGVQSVGGGGGGSWNNSVGIERSNGGSGGGGWSSVSAAGLGGSGTSGQGFRGGNGTPNGQPHIGAGGGGAAAAGGDANAAVTPRVAGNGGAGVSSSINGTATIRAGGGGGGRYWASGQTQPIGGAGGAGGGGNGNISFSDSLAPGFNGQANTGGGGGGSGDFNTAGGNGGSGIVIIRYAI